MSIVVKHEILVGTFLSLADTKIAKYGQFHFELYVGLIHTHDTLRNVTVLY